MKKATFVVAALLLSVTLLGTAVAKFPQGSTQGMGTPSSPCGYPKAADSGKVYGNRASETWARASVQSNCETGGTLYGVAYGHLAGSEPDFWGNVWTFSQRWYDRGCTECPQYSYSETVTFVGGYYNAPPSEHTIQDADAYAQIYAG